MEFHCVDTFGYKMFSLASMWICHHNSCWWLMRVNIFENFQFYYFVDMNIEFVLLDLISFKIVEDDSFICQIFRILTVTNHVFHYFLEISVFRYRLRVFCMFMIYFFIIMLKRFLPGSDLELSMLVSCNLKLFIM